MKSLDVLYACCNKMFSTASTLLVDGDLQKANLPIVILAAGLLRPYR